MAPQVVSAEKRYRMSLLLDAYGELLTEKQRTFLRRYYEEDLSFGEIAAEFAVTRQAIFDAVKHGEGSLEHYESVLGLVSQRLNGANSSNRSRASRRAAAPLESPGEAAARCADRLRALADRVAAESQPAPPGWPATELDAIAREIESLGEAHAAPPEQESGPIAEAEAERAVTRSLLLGAESEFD